MEAPPGVLPRRPGPPGSGRSVTEESLVPLPGFQGPVLDDVPGPGSIANVPQARFEWCTIIAPFLKMFMILHCI